MEELQKAAKIAFASEYAFVIKAQNFHWNGQSIKDGVRSIGAKWGTRL